MRISLSLLAAGIGGIYWLVFGFWFGRNQQDKGRARYLFGWNDPAMSAYWTRLSAVRWFHIHDWYEALKNVASEWTRLDPQRAVKLGMATLMILIPIAFAGGWLAH